MADFKLGRLKFKWRGDWAHTAVERLPLDHREPDGEDHVGDVLVVFPLPKFFSTVRVLSKLIAHVHDGLRHLRRGGRAGSRGGQRS